MIFRPELAAAIIDGRKTVTRRKRTGDNPTGKPGGWVDDPCRYRAGHTYAVQPGRGKRGIGRIRVLSVRPEFMHELTDDEIRREGFESRADFERTWRSIHGAGSYLDLVWRIEFEVVA